MIKIKADILKTFVTKCTAGALITDVKLNFGKNGLEMTHKDTPGVVFITGVLSKSVFAEYEECEISLPVTQSLIDTLSSFNDNIINIIHEDNVVRLLDENGGIDLVQAESVESAQEGIPELKYDNKILVKKSMVDTLITRNKIVKSDNLSVTVKNKELVMEIGQESNKAHTKAISGYDGDISAMFDLEYFHKITMNLDPIFDLSLSSEGIPSKFEEKTDKYNIMYFLTPITDDEIKERAKEEVKKSMEDNEMTDENKKTIGTIEPKVKVKEEVEEEVKEDDESKKEESVTTDQTFTEAHPKETMKEDSETSE